MTTDTKEKTVAVEFKWGVSHVIWEVFVKEVE